MYEIRAAMLLVEHMTTYQYMLPCGSRKGHTNHCLLWLYGKNNHAYHQEIHGPVGCMWVAHVHGQPFGAGQPSHLNIIEAFKCRFAIVVGCGITSHNAILVTLQI